MFYQRSIFQSIGQSVRCIGDQLSVKKQSDIQEKHTEEDESSDSSSEEKLSLRGSASSPLFTTIFSIFSIGSPNRKTAIHEEYKSLYNTPTFCESERIKDLEIAKNKSVEQPSAPMLHPVLLEPFILTKENLSKIKNNDKMLIKDKDKHKNVDLDNCPICLNKIIYGNLIVQAKCGHIFHHDCVKRWFVEHHTCPICRATIESA